ncbi:P-loop containing nucleoside triphosphate hydrolase protein [Ascodesmis nigricans]|uniref:P-loop containing nucleoside triphosphate hydrolase protein n=1 Tax=Ascodesmis nigricans TaxID=341454 RepID=A0A4S2MQ64_9PEZI|nr:P-loop containing nucleoside triphosphate hydrolase protein [Ascodesmis nigricans]
MAGRLARQTRAQVVKNLLIHNKRHAFSSFFRGFLLPVIFVGFIAYARYLFVQPAKYGIGSPSSVKSLADRLDGSSKRLVFVHNKLGGEVDELIQSMEDDLRGRGQVKVIQDQAALRDECKQSLRGVSDCFAAVVFESSPDNGGRWNYTLRGDSSLARGSFNAEESDNDVQKVLLPLQLAVDKAIARQQGNDVPDLDVKQYMYTDKTQEEYEEEIRRRFSTGVINYISVALLIGMIGIVYHLTGWMAHERERGLSTLIEAMGGSKTSRMLSYHISFDLNYIIGWVVMAFLLWGGVFKKTSIVIILLWHILSGFALASWSLVCGSIFKKAQLSGITVTVASLGLGVIAQVTKDSGSGAYAVLSFLFPPMNYVYFSIMCGRAEKASEGLSLVKRPPGGNSAVPGIAFFIFFVVQTLAYPFLAAFIEKKLYGTASPGHRHINSSAMDVNNAVEVRGFTKRYPPRLLSRLFGSANSREEVIAVNGLNLSAFRGQILCLLGANGSGKTTTLEAIAGLSDIKEGTISLSTGGTDRGVGICPQKNVLWDDLSVVEHVRMWNRIKTFDKPDGPEEIKKLIIQCDLGVKKNALSKNLSGGQKRKLQLAAMFTGGSSVCAIDEVSSGLDPLSRRRIWDIILAEKGSRTMLLTSHYLDEADLLGDHIVIMSKGTLKCEGSAVALKTQLGGGYRIHAPKDAPALDPIAVRRIFSDQVVYNVFDSTGVSAVVDALDEAGVQDYYVQGPTIEDVFLKVSDEPTVTRPENTGRSEKDSSTTMGGSVVRLDLQDEKQGVDLYDAQNVSFLKQTITLIKKRITILQRNYLPLIIAIVIPIVAAGLTMVVFKDFDGVSCSNEAQFSEGDIERLFATDVEFDTVIGPSSEFDLATIANLSDLLLPQRMNTGLDRQETVRNFTNGINFVESLGEFQDYIKTNFRNVTPGGLFLESPTSATYAFLGNGIFVRGALAIQNLVDNMLINTPGGIATQYRAFDIKWPKDQGTLLVFITYFGLAFAAFPAFFALYPTYERIRNVRALHYSNGVRPLPLWLAYTIFDFIPSLFICAVCVIIFAAGTTGWYGNLGYVFLILVFYSTSSILLSYIVSLYASSQLSAFAFVAGGQAVYFLIYFIVYMSVFTYSDPADLDRFLRLAHYVMALFCPIASLTKALFVALNSFSIACEDEILAPNPAAMDLFGGPILYLIVQTIVLFAFLVLRDSGKLDLPAISLFSRKAKKPDTPDDEAVYYDEKEIATELARVASGSQTDGLRVLHVSKHFKGGLTAVDDVTFGVPRGEVFALLGPNGAGKTTTINMIRGDMPPSSGEIYVENVLVNKHVAEARTHLGVCPQFDAMDRMSVTEHLFFYARIRGVRDPKHNVDTVIRAVGLTEFQHRPAEKLSGGNKRKLSLAIALMGNPAVLLLDEPSSGMDAASKRIMWRTLESVAPGRSLVLTTHSMEECSALAQRAGILAKRMLTLGTTDQLRKKHGDRYLVHLVLASAPFSTDEEMGALKSWVMQAFPSAEMETQSFGGQIRFSIPANAETDDGVDVESIEGSGEGERGQKKQSNGVAKVFGRLEREGRRHGAAFWSVDRGTMDQVFLSVVGKASVKEEGYEEDVKRPMWKKVLLGILAPWMLLR